jgi:hypothetical protein
MVRSLTKELNCQDKIEKLNGIDIFDLQQGQASLEEVMTLAQIAYINSHYDGLDSDVSAIPFVSEIKETGTWPEHSNYEELDSDL